MPARLWPTPMPIAPFSSWTHIAITARSKRGSAIPGIASSSLPDRKVGARPSRATMGRRARDGQDLRRAVRRAYLAASTDAKETMP